MSDIATAAGISRATLYLSFKSKEDIFADVFSQWIDESIAEVRRVMAANSTSEMKLLGAFDVWVVKPFEWVKTSPDAKDLIECSLAFAQESLKQGYSRFEAVIAPVLAVLATRRQSPTCIAAARNAHVIASAVRGFQQTATSVAELRKLIAELLELTCGGTSAQKGPSLVTRAAMAAHKS